MRHSPAAEIDIDAALVRSLLADQFPDLADLSLEPVSAGWDNAIFRLGGDLAVRLPRRQLAVPLVLHEHRWLPELAPRLPLPIPVPLHCGGPGPGFPWPWSVVAWAPGDVAVRQPPDDLDLAARQLGEFLAALHRPAPPDAPPNPFRGIPLAERDTIFSDNLEVLGDAIDGAAAASLWAVLMATPPWPGGPVWLHGDLHPANLLVVDGRLSAVIDFGDITSGDPATDLAVGWMLFPPDARAVFRSAAGDVDDDTWTRARGWALALAVVYLANSADAPVFTDLGHRTLAAALAG